MPSENPKQSPLVQVYAVILLLVLAGGSALLFGNAYVTSRWPWPVSPFAARFLGAIYVSEFVAAAMLLIYNRVAPGRLILAMSLPFATLGAVIPFFHPDLFDFTARKPIAWLVLYAGSALVVACFLWRHWHLPRPLVPLGGAWRRLFLTEGIVITLFGLALLIAPEATTAGWPWPVARFDAQFYSGVFIAVGVGGLILSRGAAVADLIAYGIIQLGFGLLLVAAVTFAAVSAPPPGWIDAPQAQWVWLGGCIALALLGLLSLACAATRKPALGLAPSL